MTLLYGRRRIGKSELIKQCLRESDLTGIYYECKQTSELNNVESLSEIVSEVFGFPKPAFSGMEELLKFLFEKSAEKKIILVLDEYPYIRESVRGLDSILQSLIDRYRDRAGIKLILCGSYVDTMRALLGKQNPLYGRVDVTIELKPMDYYESALFYSSFSDEDKVRLYSVFGGVPYYNRLIDTSETVRENISDNLSLFYYKYIFRNISRMGIMNPDVFYDKYIHEDFESRHVPHVFEEIGKQYLIRMNLAGRIEEPFYKIGKYYYDDPVCRKNGEFDIVTQDDRGYIFYEAKFRREPLTHSMIAEEIEQVRAAKLSCYKYGFISRSGFDAEMTDDTIFIDLGEIYGSQMTF